MAKMRISPELKKLIEKYRCVKDTEGMSPAKVYKLVGENENLSQIASSSWTPSGRKIGSILATVLVEASDSTKIGASAAA